RGAISAWASSVVRPPTGTSNTLTPGFTRFQLEASNARTLETPRTRQATRPMAMARKTVIWLGRVPHCQNAYPGQNGRSQRTYMRGVDALARILKLEGVEVLFAYPNHPLIDAAAKLGIRPLIARGEKTLINMADGYARATNGQKPTVIVVQAGPGIQNPLRAFAQAYPAGIPLLMTPGGGDQRRGGEPPQFDPLPVYRNITKWSGRINMPERIPELARRAFAQLRNGKPATVLLELPSDVSGGEV